MPKVTMTFNMPEEYEEFRDATSGSNYKSVLWDISQEVFRPYRKYGYKDDRLNALLELHAELPSGYGEKVSQAIGILEELFYELLRERGINLD